MAAEAIISRHVLMQHEVHAELIIVIEFNDLKKQ
jgi:hypothetical protein